MKFWLISFLIFFISEVSHTQETSLILEKRLKVEADQIEVDNVGNIFLLRNGAISKYDISGSFIQQNSAMSLGGITTLDASNALKMVLYFRDLSQITYLDNQLGSRGENVALDQLGYTQITQTCRSYNDGLWIYDQVSFELIRLNEYLEVTAQSGNLNQILDFTPEPTYMRENNNWLYVSDEQGILVFDWYGSYTKTIPVKGITKFVAKADRLFFIQDDYLVLYYLKTGARAGIKLVIEEVNDFTVFENKLLLITQNELVIYRINVK